MGLNIKHHTICQSISVTNRRLSSSSFLSFPHLSFSSFYRVVEKMKLLFAVVCVLLGAVTAGKPLGLLKETNSLSCLITMECVSASDPDYKNFYQRHNYECSPVEDGQLSDFSYVIDLPTEIIRDNADALASGTFVVNIPEGKILEDRVIIPNSTAMTVGDGRPILRHRRTTVATSGTRTILVLRISTLDATPTFTAQEIYNFVFDMSQPLNQPSLASQYSALSFGKLNFAPALEGVTEVYVNMTANGTSLNTIRDAAVAAVQSQFQTSSITWLADHIMFCIPPGTGAWAGVSSVNSWRLVLNDQWCGYLSGLMHEMGHNLGLLHANEGGITYMDFTSYMSAGFSTPYFPLKSFNAANNWQLGWYSDRQVTMDPSQGGKTIQLATFVDYQKGNKRNPVLLLIGMNTFLQYNRAKGFNIQTQADINQVVIVQQQSSGTSLLAGIDSANPKLVIANFDGSGRNLIIYVCSSGVGNRNNPDWIVISIGYDQNNCVQSVATPKPVRRQRIHRSNPTLTSPPV